MSEAPFLVCGFGNVGYRVSELLWRLGEAVRVVAGDARDERKREAEGRGIAVTMGDARDIACLQQAGLARARAVLALTDRDLVNLEIAIDAARFSPDRPIVMRLFDQRLGHAMGASGIGFRRAFAMSSLAAPAFAAAALGRSFVASFDLDGTAYVVGRVDVAAGGRVPAGAAVLGASTAASGDVTAVAPLEAWRETYRVRRGKAAGRTARWARLPGFARALWGQAPTGLKGAFLALLGLIGTSVFVFHIGMNLSLVDAFYFIVTTVTTTGYGDITPKDAPVSLKLFTCLVMVLGSAATAVLYSIVTDFLVSLRVRQILGLRGVKSSGHVIVAGMGTLGYRVAQTLLAEGVDVVVVDRDESGEFATALRSRAEIVVGDARIAETLLRAGAARAVAIVCTTGDDAVNLGVALAARLGAPEVRTVVRLFDGDFAAKVKEIFPLDAALSGSALAAPAFVAAALEEGAVSGFVEEDVRFVLLSRTGGAGFAGRSPTEILAGDSISVLLRRPRGGVFAAVEPMQPLAAGDELVVARTRELLPRS